ncbi:hypothetical protein DVH24_009962 [Malus domestica]|uniref:Uncharacterized protein n=1 Tax=Malus domestica TaxID=3750 RepID=A0A498JRU4_MALDO|nr:hypothetical protein DVH24_009962 [Malus domestica]
MTGCAILALSARGKDHSVHKHKHRVWDRTNSYKLCGLYKICTEGVFGTQTGRNGTGRDGTERDGTGRDGTERDGTERRRGTNPFQGVEVGRKNTQNLSRGTARSTHFWRTKRGTERLIPFRPVPSHVPNAP